MGALPFTSTYHTLSMCCFTDGGVSVSVDRRDLFSGWDVLLVPRRFLLVLVRLRGGSFVGGGVGDGDVSDVLLIEWGGVVVGDVSVCDGCGCLLRLRDLAW